MSRERTGRLAFRSRPMRLCLYLAANPDAALFTDEVARMLDTEARSVTTILAPAVHAGLVSKRVGGGRAQTLYFAGPELHKAIQAPAEDETRVVHRPAGSWERKATGLAPATWMESLA